jgi:hypothetical protein
MRSSLNSLNAVNAAKETRGSSPNPSAREFHRPFRENSQSLSQQRIVLRNAAAAFGHALSLPKLLVLIYPPGQNEALPSASNLVQGGVNTFCDHVMLLRLRQHRVLPQSKRFAERFLLRHF